MKNHSQAKIELNEARENGFYEISQAAQISGVSSKMIRYYESIDLIPPVKRTFSNYRIYAKSDIQMLSFIKRSRALGFSLEQIRTLLDLWSDERRASADVKQLVLSHVKELEEKIVEMQEMSDILRNLATSCCGNQSPECPILDDLSQISQLNLEK